MDGFLITAAQIICVICMLVPAAVLVIGKLRKRISEIKPFFAGLGICLGIAVILGIVFLNTEYSEVILILLPLTILCSSYFLYCNKFYTPAQVISFYLGLMQFASLISSGVMLLALDEYKTAKAALADHNSIGCDCHYENYSKIVSEFSSSEQYILAALIRAVIVCLMMLAIKKISTSEKLSEFKQAAFSALISTIMCMPIEMLIIWA